MRRWWVSVEYSVNAFGKMLYFVLVDIVSVDVPNSRTSTAIIVGPTYGYALGQTSRLPVVGAGAGPIGFPAYTGWAAIRKCTGGRYQFDI